MGSSTAIVAKEHTRIAPILRSCKTINKSIPPLVQEDPVKEELEQRNSISLHVLWDFENMMIRWRHGVRAQVIRMKVMVMDCHKRHHSHRPETLTTNKNEHQRQGFCGETPHHKPRQRQKTLPSDLKGRL